MATSGTLGKRRDDAVTRIEQRLSGGGGLSLPRFSRHGAETLIVLQLEAIADFLDNTVASVDYASMDVKSLKALAKQRGFTGLTEKSTLISALTTADQQSAGKVTE